LATRNSIDEFFIRRGCKVAATIGGDIVAITVVCYRAGCQSIEHTKRAHTTLETAPSSHTGVASNCRTHITKRAPPQLLPLSLQQHARSASW